MRWWLPFVALAALAEAAPRRFALIVGENRGLRGDETLRFAVDDAKRMRDVLVGLGGVAPGDALLLEGARADEVRAGLTRVLATIASHATPSDRLYVYVSSHAGDGVLHLDGTELALTELVSALERAPVEVGVLVVDACRSGSMTKLKGLARVEEAPVTLEASRLAGRVLISASGADEYAQESDGLKGSTFTHHLLTGLRGAADVSRDGRVTLDEAYAWAWARTVEATFGSRGGVQRPAYKVELSGEGQLVLTEPGAAAGRLSLAIDKPGRWLIVNAETGAIAAEVDKPAGALSLALPPGPYRVRLQVAQGVVERSVEVPTSGVAVVRGEDMEQALVQRVALKGGPASAVTLSAGGGVQSSVVGGVALLPGVELRGRYTGDLFGPINELVVALGARDARSAASGFRQTEFDLRFGLARRFFVSRLSFSIGLEVGPVLMFQNDIPSEAARTSLGGVLLGVAEVRLVVVRPLELFVLGQGGGALVKKALGPAGAAIFAASAGLALTL